MQNSEEEGGGGRKSLSPCSSNEFHDAWRGRWRSSTFAPSTSLPLPLLPLSTSSLRSSPLRLCRSSYRRCCRFSPLLVVVVRYYFLRLLFPFCLHAGVREAERNEGTRSVSAYSTRSFLSASRASSTREEKNVASKKSSRVWEDSKEFFFSRNLAIFPRRARKKKVASIGGLIRKVEEFDSLFPKSKQFSLAESTTIESRWWNRVLAWLTRFDSFSAWSRNLGNVGSRPRMRVRSREVIAGRC